MHARKPLFLISALCLWPAWAGIAQAASLDVHLTHLRPTETVRVSVYRDARTWAEEREPVASRVVAARAVSQTVRITDLPPGRYAVRVRQDPNPGGLYEPPSFALARQGSSRNQGRYGVPGFDSAAVNVGADGARLSIHLFVSSRN